MAKKNIRNWGRKALSLLLTLTMVTGMLQIPAMAASSDSQIMDGYYIVDENGVARLADMGVTTVQQDGFTLSKTISGTAKENEFNITLSVVTSQTVQSNDAAIQLVIDTSSSMKYCATCGLQTGGGFGEQCKDKAHTVKRLEAIKSILTEKNGFLDSLAKANSGKIYVSVVAYGKNATTAFEWKDIKDAANLKALKDTINALSADDNATNTHAGLMLARNRLGMSEPQGAAARFTVLLSDGYANCVGGESNSTSKVSLSGNGPSDANPTTPGTNGAKEMAKAVAKLSTVYAVGYGVDKSYLAGIIGSEDNVFAGVDSATVSAAFANIAQSAVDGMNGAGTSVNDPMGQYIVLGDVSALAAEGVRTNGNGLIWSLDPEKADRIVESGDTKTYYYSITYPITLDPSGKDFQENKYYPTNGYTYLNVPETGKEIAFLVPGVCGTIPSYEWSVEYYLQTEESINDKTPSYELDKTAEMGEAKLWTSVDAPADRADEYKRDGYYFATGDTRVMITKNAEKNVIRLYYNLVTAPVTEKHYYKTTTITRDGETIVGEYVEDSDKTSTKFALVGEKYEAAEQLKFGNVQYTFDSANPSNKTITVQKDGENLVELFYSRIYDQRTPTDAQVDHVYTEYVYELNEDGKYELVALDPVTEAKVQYSEDLPATSIYAVSAEPLAKYEGYELNEAEGDYASLLQEDESLSFVLKEEAKDNIRTLYFDKITDNREEVTVTVEHYYTKTVVSVEDGQVVTTVAPNGVMGEKETVTLYKGERFEAEELNEYLGEEYISDAGNADKLSVASVDGSKTIKLYYTLNLYPQQAAVVANHYWRTFTDVTVELTEDVIDETTGETVTVVVGTAVVTEETEDHAEEGIRYENLYEGQKHVEALRSWGEGYTYNADESTREVYAGEGEEAVIFYDKYEEADTRSAADITVQHIYTTYWTGIVDGAVKSLTIESDPVEEAPYEGKAGDEFAAVAQPTYNGEAYTKVTDDADLSVILQPGTNATIVIRYERTVNALVETSYTVSYEYYTYNMTINESGEAGYWDDPLVFGNSVSGAGYVGQEVVLNDGALAGYAPLETNPATQQTLKAEGNHWTYVYKQYNPLPVGSVTVNHHYKTVTIAVNGTSSESVQDVSGTPVAKYLGETYVAGAVLRGFRQTAVTVNSVSVDVTKKVPVTVGAATVVDYYYEKTADFSVPVTYSIAHEYYLYDWDGTPISASKPEPLVGTGFATNILVVAPESSDYELTSATYNGAALENYSITLQEGENKVVFVYEKTMARDFVNATVIHNYYKDEAALAAEEPAEKQFVETKANLPEGSTLAAEQHVDGSYVFHSATPASMEIVVTDSGENVIVLNYVRAVASYEVIHIYNRNGREEGRTSETIGGLAGDVIDAEGIVPVTEYNGKTYRFVSVTGDIVLDPEVVGTIELVYNRTVRTPDPEPETPEEEVILPDVPTIEIPDEEVPLGELPEVELPVVEIPDEEVPLAEVPKTGDETLRFVFLALASALGLAGLQVIGRKREEEEI